MNTQKKDDLVFYSKKDVVDAITQAFKQALNATNINIRDLTWFSNKDLSSNHPVNIKVDSQ